MGARQGSPSTYQGLIFLTLTLPFLLSSIASFMYELTSSSLIDIASLVVDCHYHYCLSYSYLYFCIPFYIPLSLSYRRPFHQSFGCSYTLSRLSFNIVACVLSTKDLLSQQLKCALLCSPLSRASSQLSPHNLVLHQILQQFPKVILSQPEIQLRLHGLLRHLAR